MSEEFIMEFKSEERMAQTTFLSVFEVDDLNSNSSTITAPETNGSRRSLVTTPHLLNNLKKCRVLIKKLPHHTVAKYSGRNKRNVSSASLTPARTSKRLEAKTMPGKYLALHVNKPLKVVLDKKAKQSSKAKGPVSLKDKKESKNIGYLIRNRQIDSKKSLNNYFQSLRSERNNVRISTKDSNQPPVSHYSDLIETKYSIPTSSNHTSQEKTHHKSSLSSRNTKHYHNSPQASSASTLSLKSNASNQYVIHKFNIADAAITKPCGNDSRPQQLISIFPVENALNNSNISAIPDPPKKTPNHSIATQPNSLQSDAVMVNSSKVLVINQPALKNDPLNLPAMQAAKRKSTYAKYAQKSTNSDTETADSESEIADNVKKQKRTKPEVVKRIVYQSKYTQTKFTCSGNICGLVDTNGGFNLNCFYCYDIFPLHKWQQFKQHINQVHHVEEKEMESNDDTPTTSPTRTLTPIKEGTKYLKHSPIKRSVQSKSENLTPKTYLNNSFETFNDDIRLDNDGDGDDEDDEMFKDLIQNLTDEDSEGSTEAAKFEDELKTCNQTPADISNQLPSSLKQVTTKNINAMQSDTENRSNQMAAEETFIKLPSNLNIQQVLKTIPKTTGQSDNTDGIKKPRYFVVKKVINPVNSESKTKLNAPTNVVLKKVPPLKQCDNDDDEMPSNDENEDPMPKPTNGCGILFGLTNRMVVIEFLLKLKTLPELWRPQVKNDANIDYDESVRKLCDYLNNRFVLNIKDFEIHLSIQRVKDWYCRMLRNIHEHNKTCKSREPYPHKFPVYFKILNQFLTSDVHCANNLLLNSRFKSDTALNDYPKWMVYKTECTEAETPLDETVTREQQTQQQQQPRMIVYNTTYHDPKPTDQSTRENTTQHLNKTSQPSTQPSTQSNTPPTTPPTTPPFPELDDDMVIEFDADTLYGNESSSDEILEQFDETKKENGGTTDFRPEKKRTKIYSGHFPCDNCTKVFKRKCDLDRHRVHHFPPKYQCSVCSNKYYFQHWAEKCSHLKKIISNSENEENSNNDETTVVEPIKIKPKWPKKIFRFKMICETCGAAYRSIGSLNAHKKDKHLNQRLKCVVCNFTAITNYRIVQHQKKRHIVEPGTVEEVAKKSRARTDTKTPFSVEARQEFDWRREMRKKLKPGEKFFGCCKCRIVFETRKEKVLHNKTEHPIKETTVICLLCLPEKMLLSNSNSVRRHYTDIHKVPWDEIDALVKRTKPVFNFLTKEQIELINASENYNELLKEMLKDINFETVKKEEVTQEDVVDEATKAILNLTRDANGAALIDDEVSKMEVEIGAATEDNVYIDGVIDHDYNNECNEEEQYNEHNYSEDHTNNENNAEYYEDQNSDMYDNNEQHHEHQTCVQEQSEINVVDDVDVVDEEGECTGEGMIRPMAYHIECHNEEEIQEDIEFMDGQLVEECIVVEEECIDDIIDEDEYY